MQINTHNMEKLDFSRLLVPVHTVEMGQDIIHKFPELRDFPEFSMYAEGDRNYVIRYVVYAYDPESPIVKKSIMTLAKRKEAAADLAGFERHKKSGLFEDGVYEIMDLKNEAVTAMILRYLKIVNSLAWTQIVTYEQQFWEYAESLLDPLKKEKDTDEKKFMESLNIKGKIRVEFNNIKQDLESLKKEFYGTNADLQEKVERARPETIYKSVIKVS